MIDRDIKKTKEKLKQKKRYFSKEFCIKFYKTYGTISWWKGTWPLILAIQWLSGTPIKKGQMYSFGMLLHLAELWNFQC